jgi:hypothetical protein
MTFRQSIGQIHMSRVWFNILFSFFGCSGFHVGMNAGAVQHVLSDLHSPAFLGATLVCIAMNQVGLFQSTPIRGASDNNNK